MWIFTNKAAVSVVQDWSNPLHYWVRSRTKGQVEAFCAPLERRVKVEVTPKNDYAYRTKVTLGDLETLALASVRSIDYTNFKDSIVDNKFHSACSKVWSALMTACGTGCYATPKKRAKGIKQTDFVWP